jgi:signal peptidase
MKSKHFFLLQITHGLFSSIFIRDDGYVKFLTKGDNNQVDDRGLYSPGQLWLEKKDVVGRARGY